MRSETSKGLAVRRLVSNRRLTAALGQVVTSSIVWPLAARLGRVTGGGGGVGRYQVISAGSSDWTQAGMRSIQPPVEDDCLSQPRQQESQGGETVVSVIAPLCLCLHEKQ